MDVSRSSVTASAAALVGLYSVYEFVADCSIAHCSAADGRFMVGAQQLFLFGSFLAGAGVGVVGIGGD